jgi:ribosomal protein S18 acetylase RimI-like enzyme
MLPDAIKSLILEEQARQSNRFVEGVDLEVYLVKLGEKAEILSDSVHGRCRGLVAYYCNDESTRQAFVTLVLVNPLDRGLGLGAALLSCVLSMARSRGFTTCRLEVARENEAAQALYRSLGFRPVGERSGKDLLEVAL